MDKLFRIFLVGVWLCAAGAAAEAASSSEKYERGVELYMKGQYAEAYAAFTEYLKDNPNHMQTIQWIDILGPMVKPKAGAQTAPAAPAPKTAPELPKPAPVPASAPAPVSSSRPDTDLGREVNRLKTELETQKTHFEEEHRSQISQLEEVSRILSETDRNLTASEKARRETEARLESLESERDDLAAKIEGLKAGASSQPAAQAQVSQLQSELDKTRRTLDGLRSDYNAAEGEKNRIAAELRSLKDTSTSRDTDTSRLQSRVLDLQGRLAQAESALKQSTLGSQAAAASRTETEQRIAGLEREKGNLLAELQSLRQSAGESAARTATLQKDIDSLKARVVEAQAASASRSDIERRAKQIEQEKNSLLQEKNSIASELSTLKVRVTEAQTSAARAENEKSSLLAQVKELQDAKARLFQAEGALKQSSVSALSADAARRDAERTLARLEAENNELLAEVRSLRQSAGDSGSRASILENQINDLKARAADARNAAERAENEKSSLLSQLREFQDVKSRLDQAEGTLKQSSMSAQTANMARRDTEKRLAQLEQEKNSLAKDLESFRASVNAKEGLINESQAYSAGIKSELDETKAALIDAQRHETKVVQETVMLRAQLAEARSGLDKEKGAWMAKVENAEAFRSQMSERLEKQTAITSEIQARESRTKQDLDKALADLARAREEAAESSKSVITANSLARERDALNARIAEMSGSHKNEIARILQQGDSSQSALKAELAGAKEREAVLHSEIDKKSAELSDFQARLSKLQSDSGARDKAVQDLKADLETELDRARAETAALTAQLKDAAQTRDKLEAQLADTGRDKSSLSQELESLRAAKTGLETAKSGLEKELEARTSALEAERASKNQTAERLEKQTAVASDIQAREDRTKAELEKTIAELAKAREAFAQTETARSSAQAGQAALKTELDKARAEAAALARVNSELQTKLGASQKEGLDLRADAEKKISTLSSLESQIAQLQNSSVTRDKDAQAREAALKAALEEARVNAAKLAVERNALDELRGGLEKRLSSVSGELAQSQAGQEDAREHILRIEARAKSLEADAAALGAKLASVEAGRNEIALRLENQTMVNSETQAREAKLKTELAETTTALAKAREDRDALGRALDTAKQSHGAQASALQAELQTVRDALARSEKSAKELDLARQSLENELAGARSEITKAAENTRALQSEKEKLSARTIELYDGLQKTAADLETAQTGAKRLAAELEARGSDNAALTGELESLRAQLTRLSEEKSGLESRLAETSDALAKTQAESASLDRTLRARLEETQSALVKTVDDKNTAAADLKLAVERLTALKNESDGLKNTLASTTLSLEKTRASETDLKAQTAKLQANLAETESKFHSVSLELDKSGRSAADARSEVQVLMSQKAALGEEINGLKQEIAGAQASDAEYRRKLSELNDALARLLAEKGAVESEAASLQEIEKGLRSEIQNARADAARSGAELEAFRKSASGREDSLKLESSRLAHELSRASDEIGALKGRVQEMEYIAQQANINLSGLARDRGALVEELKKLQADKDQLSAQLVSSYDTMANTKQDSVELLKIKESLEKKLQDLATTSAQERREAKTAEATLGVQLREANTTLERLAEERKAALAKFEEMRMELQQAVQTRDALQSEAQSLREEKTKLATQLIGTYDTLAKTTSDYDRSQKLRAELESKVAQQNEELERLLTQTQVQEANIKARFKDINAALSKATWSGIAGDVAKDELVQNPAGRPAERSDRNATLTEELHSFESSLEDINDRLNKTTAGYENIQKVRSELERVLKETNREKEMLAHELESLKETKTEVQERANQQERLLSGAQSNEAQLKARIRELEEGLQSHRSSVDERLGRIEETGRLPAAPAAESPAPLPAPEPVRPEAVQEPDAPPKSVWPFNAPAKKAPEIKLEPHELRILMIQPKDNYLVLSLNTKNITEGSKLVLTKNGQPVYQVEVKSVYDSNVSTAKIMRRLDPNLELTKGDICRYDAAKL